MPYSHVQAISFDAGGTLISPQPSVGAVYAEVLARHRVTIQAFALDVRFKEAFQRIRKNPSVRVSEASERAYWREVVAYTIKPFYRGEHFELIFNDLYAAFSSALRWRLEPGAADILDALRSAGYRLVLLSNSDARFRNVFSEMRLLQHFDAFLLSSEIGYEKPDPRAFAAAEAALGLPPEAFLHIGDSTRNDVMGAFEAGWQSIQYLPTQAPEPGLRIQQLSELKQMLPVRHRGQI